jgi:Metal-dependent hydrolases of the beta-lactamase superfamily I
LIRFAMLGSGSKGNATVIQSGRTTVLMDCGFSPPEVDLRLARLGLSADALDAILVTHEHGDHIAGVARLAARQGIPIHATSGSASRLPVAVEEAIRRFDPHSAFAIGDLQVTPFPVPHDAREPCQFVFGDGACRVGVLSDIGTITPHVRAMLDGCEALLLEFNHDPAMLAAGPYSRRLKRRVAGNYGHLSNQQAAELLTGLNLQRLRHLVPTHLSLINNTPELALAAAAGALGCHAPELLCADQALGLDWREIS